jgi:S-adenosylmethionine hydrolase
MITLLTDFGLADTYVGQVKGAILSVAPEAALVDLTHAVPAQDVVAGAFLLWAAVEVFPSGSVHLAVVDPGVGSARRGVAARSGRSDVFVGPDNGLLVPALEHLGGVDAAVELVESAYWRPSPASTFHGRDVFGPVAAHLSLGVALDRLGPNVVLQRPFELPQPLSEGQRLRGEVLHLDTFGNLITNLPAERLPARYSVDVAGLSIEPQPSYQAVAPGMLLALVGSSGLLEISARDASAAAILGATRGARVDVLPR